MKTFYQFLKDLNEEVKTPEGHILTPEELEEYENEKSPMYKSLLLKQIDARKKAELENSPERTAAKEKERFDRDEHDRLHREKNRKELEELKKKEREEQIERNKTPREKMDYIIKFCGVMVSAITNASGCLGEWGRDLLKSLGLIESGGKWKIKHHLGEFPVEPYEGNPGKPANERDYDIVKNAMDLFSFALEDHFTFKKELCMPIWNLMIRLGAEPIHKVGEVVKYAPLWQTTTETTEPGEDVRVIKGYAPASFSEPSMDGGIVFKTERGPFLCFRALVEPVNK